MNKVKTKRSKYFIPFKKDTTQAGPIGTMIKGAFVHQEASGIYTWLSLGMRMLEKIIKIIDEEHEKADALKICLPTLHDAKLWKASKRYAQVGPEMLKIFDRHNREFVYGPSAEEIMTNLITKWGLNKNSFPLLAYNIQWKFRDEIRPRFGTVRSREFLMKDAYSFHKTKECMQMMYEKMFNVYSNIFHKLQLKVATFASDTGIMGGSLSHEFVVQSEFGETQIAYDNFPSDPIKWSERDNATLKENDKNETKFAEIGQLYALDDKYTKIFKALNPENNEPLYMGCYGIGVSRLVSILFEQSEHDLGKVAPFKYTIISIGNDENVIDQCVKLFTELDDVIWDDREVSYGVKCAEADLIKSPIQIHIGKKELENNIITIKQKGKKTTIHLDQLTNFINQFSLHAICH